jgi:hypothetical protein
MRGERSNVGGKRVKEDGKEGSFEGRARERQGSVR